ncbi:MAG: DUF1016 N-terminal domain-containing protein [Tannerella forsythia]|uniref:DUF1016 N-terminal domain-containing protein n=1 Tax=Tannerella forsythia TaxID=28112 RepID=UPI0036120DE0
MQTLFAQLTWSHFQKVLRVSDEKARIFYLTEAAENMWSVRTLDRNISINHDFRPDILRRFRYKSE